MVAPRTPVNPPDPPDEADPGTISSLVTRLAASQEGTISGQATRPPAAGMGTISGQSTRPGGPVSASALSKRSSRPTGAGDTFGRYEVKREIARGGMGVVLLARDTTLRRQVALKLMLDETVSDDLLRRFLIEAEAGGRLTHPFICQVYDVGVVDEIPYLTMELIDGRALDECAKDMEARAIAELMAQVGEGVGYAHNHGVVHRDLKPANVFVEYKTDTPKIMDFGIAKVVDRATAHGLTIEGELMGTPAYMSPEQAEGRADVDARSDVYALGAILYELLTGQRTFLGTSLTEVLYQVAFVDPRPLRQIDPTIDWELEAITLKALEKDRTRRYADGDAFSADLRRYLDGLPIKARQATLFYRLGKFVRRKRELVAGVGLAALVLLSSLGFFGYKWRADQNARNDSIAGAVAAADRNSAAADLALAEFRDQPPGALSTDEAKAHLTSKVRAVRVQAIGHAAEALALDPAHPAALTLKARQEAGLEAIDGLMEDLVRAQSARDAALEAAKNARAEADRLVVAGQAHLDTIDLDAIASEADVKKAQLELDAARSAWIQALGLVPDHVGAREALDAGGEVAQAVAGQRALFEGRARAEAQRLQGAEALTEGRLRDAVTQFDMALAHDNQNPRARAGRLEAGVKLAERALRDGNLDLVDYMLDQVERLDRSRAASLRERVAAARTDAAQLKAALSTADLQRVRGEFTRAIASYRLALRVDPDHPGARYGLAAAEAGEAETQERYALALQRWLATADVAPDPATRVEAEQTAARVRDTLILTAAASARASIDAGDAASARKTLSQAVAAVGESATLTALQAEVEERGRAPKGFVYVAEGDIPFGADPAPALVPCTAFAVARLEVTNAEYAEFVRAGGYDKEELFRAEAWAGRERFRDASGGFGPAAWKGGHPAGSEELPVTGVSFFEAEAYARWRGARLLTSLEWEKACLWDPAAGSRQPTPWAESVEASAQLPPPWDAYLAREQPLPVGALVQLAEGVVLHDQSPLGVENGYGNVHEWCVDPKAIAVARGGSFLSLTAERAHGLRTHARDPWLRHRAIGLRLAADVQR